MENLTSAQKAANVTKKQERNAKIAELKAKGLTLDQIAEQTGVCRRTVASIISTAKGHL